MTSVVEELVGLLRRHGVHDLNGDDEWLDDQLSERFEGLEEKHWSDLVASTRRADEELARKLVVAIGRLAPRDAALAALDTISRMPLSPEAQMAAHESLTDLLTGDRAQEGFEMRSEPLNERVIRHEVWRNGERASFKNVLHAMRDEWTFRNLFHWKLAAVPYDAFFWETPPITLESAERPFEYIVCDAPVLTRRAADPGAFRAHFQDATHAVTFTNLGGDATLVAPVPASIDYPHIGAFVRHAPQHMIGPFWHQVAVAMLSAIGDEPRWLSTSGAGVPWLHVRIDSRPKYYVHAPYRVVSSQ